MSDDPRRILIGVGRTLDTGQFIPYIQDGDGFTSVLRERVVSHSIWTGMQVGFLLPCHDLIAMAAEQDLIPAEYAVYVPEEFTAQFSYVCEHVSHDAALSLLLALDKTVVNSRRS